MEEQRDQIRLTSLQVCSCREFESLETHYAVSIWQAKISETKAVAISYTWGEFNRTNHHIGHLKGSQTAIMLNLGAEWSVSHFLKTLCDLSAEEGCWIDQICVPQKTDEIRKTLAAIPTVYQTLHVITVLPGPICNCLRRAFEEWEKATILPDDSHAAAKEPRAETSFFLKMKNRLFQSSEKNSVAADTAFESATHKLYLALHGNWCLTSNGCCSWSNRIWTYQELRYSTRNTTRFVNSEIVDCATQSSSDRDKFESLPGYIGCGLTHDETIGKIVRMNRMFYLKASAFRPADFLTSNLVRVAKSPHEASEVFARRLLGETAVLEAFDPEHPSHRLHDGCEALRRSKLTATQPKDYVLSVWPGSKFYKIPENIKALTVFELLADALKQMRYERPGIFEFYCPSVWPAGLFGVSEGSVHWDPELYTPSHEIKDSRDIYGAFRWMGTVNCSMADFGDHTVPIHVREKSAEGTALFDYDFIVSDVDHNEKKIRMLNLMLRFVEDREEYRYEGASDDLPPFLPLEAADPEKALFDYVCEALTLGTRDLSAAWH